MRRPGANEPDDDDVKPRGWRGDGILVQGGFRIRDLTFSLDGVSATAEVRTDTWHHWLAAAEDACEVGRKAREDSVCAEADHDFLIAIEREFRASMVALSSAAFAIDAFYASTVERASAAKVVASSRDASIFETLKRAFDLRTTDPNIIRNALVDIFRYRDQAVHPPARFIEPVPHPVFGLQMEPRFVMFRIENAESTRAFVHQIIWRCLDKPNAAYPELVEWCEAAKTNIQPPPLP